ncbi:hypothetical protein BX600DRAFT_496931 [Xylariales sp. PMI_506]|nr:hypothetical protein BX600DRAFT_496931 [Xylariales sp. PMI_506]
MDTEAADSLDIQAKVLQSTLNEVAARNEQGSQDHVECCVICLDTIIEPSEARPCQHRHFDFLCLASWLEQKSQCPLCKAEVKEVRYEFTGTEDARQWKTFIVPTKKDPAKGSAPRRPLPPRRNWPYYRPHRRWHYEDSEASSPASAEDEQILRRRQVYRERLYSLHVGSNRTSQYRDITPQLFEQDAALVSRARMWLRRELKVFEFLQAPSASDAQRSDDVMTRRRANNAEFLLEYIIAILKTVDIQGSQGQAEDMLQEFLGREHTRLLLHELKSYLRSPYILLKDWDRAVQYDTGAKDQHPNDEPNGLDRGQGSSTRSSPTPRPEVRHSGGRFRGDSYRPQYAEGSQGQSRQESKAPNE